MHVVNFYKWLLLGNITFISGNNILRKSQGRILECKLVWRDLQATDLICMRRQTSIQEDVCLIPLFALHLQQYLQHKIPAPWPHILLPQSIHTYSI